MGEGEIELPTRINGLYELHRAITGISSQGAEVVLSMDLQLGIM